MVKCSSSELYVHPELSLSHIISKREIQPEYVKLHNRYQDITAIAVPTLDGQISVSYKRLTAWLTGSLIKYYHLPHIRTVCS